MWSLERIHPIPTQINRWETMDFPTLQHALDAFAKQIGVDRRLEVCEAAGEYRLEFREGSCSETILIRSAERD